MAKVKVEHGRLDLDRRGMMMEREEREERAIRLEERKGSQKLELVNFKLMLGVLKRNN